MEHGREAMTDWIPAPEYDDELDQLTDAELEELVVEELERIYSELLAAAREQEFDELDAELYDNLWDLY
jgi:Ni,Fe-hydrogenase III large subunit